MKVTVTQSDIDNGTPLSGQWCPIAIAAQRVFNIPIRVLPNNICTKDFKKSWPIPQSAKQFVLDFDSFKHVEPFEFEVVND